MTGAMPIWLFTDFGAADIYVGQVRAALYRHAPGATVNDLLHAVPAFNVQAGAHLLAALAAYVTVGSVIMAVVDPGVGGAREPVALNARDTWFVGPDNGLLSVVAARANVDAAYPVGLRPAGLSASFHGRDLFAPVAAMIACGRADAACLGQPRPLAVRFDAADLPEIIYIDHYGNAMTGLRTGSVKQQDRLVAGGRELTYARVFSEVPPGEAFWYENSMGLIEVAVNAGSASDILGMRIGHAVEVKRSV